MARQRQVGGESTQRVATGPKDARPGDVLVVAGNGQLTTHPITGKELVIGRAPECDVVVAHKALSRRHAVLRLGSQQTVEDLGSTNGVRIDGRRIPEGEPIAIAAGASFHIGPFAFLLVHGRGGDSSIGSGRDPFRIEDPTFDRASTFLRDIAASGVNVLVLGETGVGKEVLAETMHRLSKRDGPLIRVNCAALSETLLESEMFGHCKGAFTGATTDRAGLLEAAEGGTVFLDEVGELPTGTQAKLLRALEAREVLRIGATQPVKIDVRFVAATNRDLPVEVEAGRFRRDLYFRLDGVTLSIPPLRERHAMIGLLALGFLDAATRRIGGGGPRLAPELLAVLEAHPWPGNVRELKAAIDRVVLLARGGEISRRHLALATGTAAREPAPAATGEPDLSFLDAAQRRDRARIIAVLEACAGNQTRAARELAMSRSTLVTRLTLYKIARPKAR